MKEFVDKLIGRLEEEIEYDTFDHYKEEPLINMSFERLEDIVNQLAEEYNNDFCEWEIYGNRKHAVTGHGQVKYTYEVEDWLVCPYCGKKIKIAPYQPKGE
ncbi:MAG: hypothetical protein J6Q61_00155 [Bacteroidales bacterium]|nr:hypothetical protein [Bacteroidales bacterium]